MLTKLASIGMSDIELRPWLRQLASLALCLRYHQNQVEDVVSRWERKIATMRPAVRPSNRSRADSAIGEDNVCVSDERAERLERERKVFEEEKRRFEAEQAEFRREKSLKEFNDMLENMAEQAEFRREKLRKEFDDMMENMGKTFEEIMKRLEATRRMKSDQEQVTREHAELERCEKAGQQRPSVEEEHKGQKQAKAVPDREREEEAEAYKAKFRAREAREREVQKRREEEDRRKAEDRLRQTQEEEARKRRAKEESERRRRKEEEEAEKRRQEEEKEAKERREREERNERCRRRAEEARKERERQAKEKAERERKEWDDVWIDYSKRWEEIKSEFNQSPVSWALNANRIPENGMRGSPEHLKKIIPWPVKSLLWTDATEEAIEAFFKMALPADADARKRLAFMRMECLNWHTDRIPRMFGRIEDKELADRFKLVAQVAIRVKG